MNDVVKVEGLVKRFGSGRRELVAVSDVSFSVPEGSCLGIVGESGSGKSTTARMIVGLELPSEGRIEVAGVERSGRPRRAERLRRAKETQMVFQDPYLSLNRREAVGKAVSRNLVLHGISAGRELRARTLQMLDAAGLQEEHADKLPHQLSGGQRQRVAIARALAAEPRVLVLDEAVSALDVSVQAQILDLLRELRATKGITYLFVSHDLAVIHEMSDAVIVMRNGRVVEQGPCDGVLRHPKSEYTRMLRQAIPRQGWVPRLRLQTGAAGDGGGE